MRKVFSVLTITCFLAACNNGANKETARQKTIDSLNAVIAKQKVIDSMKAVMAKRDKNNTQAMENSGADQNTAAETKKKKGLGTPVKGALIGAGTGAVAGAIIDKKHGEGAVVGGLIGAGLGATTGVIIDKSKKKKKKRTASQ